MVAFGVICPQTHSQHDTQQRKAENLSAIVWSGLVLRPGCCGWEWRWLCYHLGLKLPAHRPLPRPDHPRSGFKLQRGLGGTGELPLIVWNKPHVFLSRDCLPRNMHGTVLCVGWQNPAPRALTVDSNAGPVPTVHVLTRGSEVQPEPHPGPCRLSPHTLSRQSPIPGPLCWRFNIYLLYILAALLHTPLGLRRVVRWQLSALVSLHSDCWQDNMYTRLASRVQATPASLTHRPRSRQGGSPGGEPAHVDLLCFIDPFQGYRSQPDAFYFFGYTKIFFQLWLCKWSFASFQLVLWKNCSTWSCIFDVFMGVGEL